MLKPASFPVTGMVTFSTRKEKSGLAGQLRFAGTGAGNLIAERVTKATATISTITPKVWNLRVFNILVSSIDRGWLDCQSMTTV
jgi:hypothetical protein